MNKKRTILVIEDYQSLRENVVDFLNLSGFDVIAAKDGAEGIQKALSHIPDLIICDIQMPNLDGYQVFNSLQQISGTSVIPFIFITAKVQPDEIRTGLQLGVDDYITKPFGFDELLSSVNKRLAKYDKIKASVEEKFKILLNSPLNATFILTDGKIHFGNDKFMALLNDDPKNVINKKFENFVAPESQDLFLQSADKCLKNIIDLIHIELTLINTKNEKIKADFFAKNMKTKDQNFLIGNIVQIHHNTSTPKHANEINEYYNNNYEIIYPLIQNMINDNINIDSELSELAKEIEQAQNKRIKKIIEANELTARELEVLACICEGLTNTEIADRLFISARTVDNHRARLLEKTNCKNTAQLVAFAVKHKLVQV